MPVRLGLAFVSVLSGCYECTLFGDARWEVGLFNLPDDVDVIRVTTDDRFEGVRTCEVIYEPMETRWDWGPGPDEPDIASMDCPDASWVHVYLAALYVSNDTPRKFTHGDVSLEFTRIDGTTGGFDWVTVRPDWGPDVLDPATDFCNTGATADNYLDALTGERFYPP